MGTTRRAVMTAMALRRHAVRRSEPVSRRGRVSRCERGAVALLLSAGLGLIGAAVVAVDVGSIRTARHHLHENAGGAALAALAELPDADAARTSAFTYAAANDVAGLGTLDDTDDIEFGWWDPDAEMFMPTGTGGDVPVSAVRVTAHREEVETNVGGVVAPVLGMETTDLTATEVASVALTTIHFEGIADGPVPATLGAGTGTDLDERDGLVGVAAVSPPGVAIGIVDLRCGLGCPGVDATFDDAHHALVSAGGTVTFDFSSLGDGAATPWSIRVLGAAEDAGTVTIVYRDGDGSVLGLEEMDSPPPGASVTWFLEPAAEVTEMIIRMPDGAAIDDLRLATGLTVVT
ncbi:MAG: hypothetical protein RIE08_14930 [Acidimicrobiales bacterium]